MLDFSWDEGTISGFVELSKANQANRGGLQELADNSATGLIGRAVAAATLKLRDVVSGFSPVDTGTLASAHRGEVEPNGSGVQGIVFIDPYAVNPVNRGKPAVYGEVWAMRYHNWFELAADLHGDAVMDQLERTILDRVDDLWR